LTARGGFDGNALTGPRIARVDLRHHEIRRQTTKRGAPLPEGDRRPRRRRGGATGDPLGTSRHAGEQERGSSAPPGGLQDPAPQDEALQDRGRGVSRVVTYGSSAMVWAP